ncbi:MAG: hypothetical protein ACHQFW_11880 [Chitinophagales bacterium]
MKPYNIISVSALSLFILVFASCNKDVDIPKAYFADPDCEAGRTGTIKLHLLPEHHGEPIPSQPSYPDTAYIKFNATEYPGGDDPSLYDLVVTGTSGSFEVVVDNMSCGNYFIFMTGFDVSISERVKGGIPVTLHGSDVERSIKIPVTED